MTAPQEALPGNRTGIMLGRLSPRSGGRIQAFPWLTWQGEFGSAAACGFDSIEWLVTSEKLEQNPLWTDAGVAMIRRQIARTGVEVHSVCADYFIVQPLVRVPETILDRRLDVLRHLVRQSARLNVSVILVPMLEDNEFRCPSEADQLLRALAPIFGVAAASGITIGLETNLPADDLLRLVPPGRPDTPRVYYDTGNAAAIGRDAGSEIRALSQLLCGVHIKDKQLDGPSVPLGAGDADFESVFDALEAIGYAGSLVLETPIGDDPIVSAKRNVNYVRERIAAARERRQQQ